MTVEDEVIDLMMAAADGEIVGRVRFHKIAYLLEEAGMHSGIWFSYHHYGPFSRDLADALDHAVVKDRVREDQGRRSDSNPYSIFRSAAPQAGDFDGMTVEQARALVQRMKDQPSVVLELAATIHWLREKERVADWREELRQRKTIKATDGNIERALTVLDDLGLAA
ncbi:MAG: hypothetical protein RID91_14840 [Azospirillaceae bacterium]